MDYPVDVGLLSVGNNNNNNNNNGTYVSPPPWYRYNVWVSGTLCTAYGLVFCAGLLGNIQLSADRLSLIIIDYDIRASTGNLLVAVVVLRGSRTMRRCVTNLFLVNLAFADLLVVLACLPFTLVAHLIYRKWIFVYGLSEIFFLFLLMEML